MADLDFFAPCPRGLEAVLVEELVRLDAQQPRSVPGGVHFRGALALGYNVNLWSRVASRVLMRVHDGDYRNEHDVYHAARAISWERWFVVDRSIRVDVTAIRSPLKSLEFATLRVKDAVCDRFRDLGGRRPDVDTRNPDVRIFAFLTDRRLTLYLDLSGEPLFKRGYRADTGEAPLRENLAAGVLALTGWQPDESLLDPMCGSGTFLIEAAMIGCNLAPGRSRSFGFERLRSFDAGAWQRLCEQARQGERRDTALDIRGSDRDARVLRAATESIEQAGLAASISIERADALDVVPGARPGVLVTNPPYGVRLESEEVLRTFYPAFGNVLKQRFSGWRCYVLTPESGLPGLIRLRESKRTPLFNGAIECRLFEFRMVSGSLRTKRGAPNGD